MAVFTQEPLPHPPHSQFIELYWNTRGGAIKVTDPKLALTLRQQGFKKVTDPKVRPGEYNPAYDQGTHQEFKTMIEAMPKMETVSSRLEGIRI